MSTIVAELLPDALAAQMVEVANEIRDHIAALEPVLDRAEAMMLMAWAHSGAETSTETLDQCRHDLYDVLAELSEDSDPEIMFRGQHFE